MANGTTTVALKTPVRTSIKNSWTEVKLAARREWMEFHIKKQRPALIEKGKNDEQISTEIASKHVRTMHPMAVQLRIRDMFVRGKISENPNPIPAPGPKNSC